MAESRRLKAVRAQLKGQVTRINTFLTSTQDVTYAQAQSRVGKLHELWAAFDSNQTQLEVLKITEDDQMEQVMQQEQGEREVFEESYYRALDKAHSIMELMASAQQQIQRQENERRALPGSIDIKLPTLKLPIFGGEYDQWMLFKDAFESLIHNNHKLSAVQKFQYLRSSLRDEALQAISGLNTSAANYQVAWELVTGQYGNKRLIINSHLAKLLEFPIITRDKHTSLRQFIMHLRTHLKALEVLGQPTDQWATLIIFLARNKLDHHTQHAWEEEVGQQEPDRMPTIEELLKFLSERCRTLEMLDNNKAKPDVGSKSNTSKKPDKRVTVAATTSQVCSLCKESHRLYDCAEFLKLPAQDRRAEVKRRQLCINCLRAGHYAKDCKSSTCRKCSKAHNTLLHMEQANSNKSANKESDNSSQKNSETAEMSMVMHCPEIKTHALANSNTRTAKGDHHEDQTTSQVILSTAQVYVRDRESYQQTCRALLDPGSQSNFITEDLLSKLQLPCRTEKQAIHGIMQIATNTQLATKICIESQHSGFKANLDCLVLPAITERLPQCKLNRKLLNISRDQKLADPNFDKPGKIDLLIGAGLFWNLLCVGQIKMAKGNPTWQKTQLGWIIGGELIDAKTKVTSTSLLVVNKSLNEQIERFWIQEEVPELRQLTTQEKYCEEQYASTVSRDPTGRFIVSLPKNKAVTIGSSREGALQRFKALERRFKRQPNLKEDYVRFMEEYEGQGHMKLVDWNTLKVNGLTCFLPHHSVLRPDHLTTKVRVVFDASARTSNDRSLNDMLLAGPNLQNDLMHLLLRFRIHKYVLTADIAMMFRQILVTEEDNRLQLIVWRKSEDLPMGTYALKTVTYGTNCAPYLAMRCLRQLASENKDQHPQAAQVLQSDFYMDDLLTGTDDLEDVIALQDQLTALLAKGRFILRKWRSNDARILSHLEEEGKSDSLLMLNKDEPLKTLGLFWNHKTDFLQYSIRKRNDSRITKRTVFSAIAQIYDPLGLLGPILIVAKLIMQQLWSINIEWDEGLPQELHSKWKDYHSSLSQLSELQIPRCIKPQGSSKKIDILGFSDASERAYGACIYGITSDEDDNPRSYLICAKSRVAPLKTQTLAKLELCAALLLAKLYRTVYEAIGSRIDKTHLWTDSTIVISWIHACPSTLKTFVANRVSKIQRLTSQVTWHHVPSDENPADILSRGTTASELRSNHLWWYGPNWFHQREDWPEQPGKILDFPEKKIVSALGVTVAQSTILPDVSSFERLVRTIAYCHRFVDGCRKLTHTRALTVRELERAETTVIKLVQQEAFSQEIQCLQTNKPLKANSRIIAFDTYLDTKGLIRVGGRLSQARIQEAAKHPIMLPAKHRVTNLIFREEHVKLHHCGTEQLLVSIRQRYWPLSGRQEARKVVRSCLNCFRLRARGARAKMGDLPEARVSGFMRPFTICGVDYAGPIQIREGRRRGRTHVSKAYIALFICFHTKAVHMELVTSLTTECFLAALHRFTGRRGMCSHIFSDNGTNFVGAQRELSELYEFLKGEEGTIHMQLARQKINWSFIPPRTPNFGGLWESAVKRAKYHFNAVTKGLVLTFEECYTLLVGIEAVLNSRPLTPCSNDPQDLSVLTPSHYLVGDFLLQPVEGHYTAIPENRLSRWQHIQRVRQDFWHRWQREYLTELQRRNIWTRGDNNLQEGMLVLLRETQTPPLQWHIGRIVSAHPGRDGAVRVVTVKTIQGQYKRSARSVCVLPIDDNFDTPLKNIH